MNNPKCPFCKADFSNPMNIGHKTIDVSTSNPDRRFLDVGYCNACSATININQTPDKIA